MEFTEQRYVIFFNGHRDEVLNWVKEQLPNIRMRSGSSIIEFFNRRDMLRESIGIGIEKDNRQYFATWHSEADIYNGYVIKNNVIVLEPFPKIKPIKKLKRLEL